MKTLTLLTLLVFSFGILAQEKSPLEESLSYFKNGVVLEHKPTHFKTQFRFRVQSRFTYQSEEAEKYSAEVVDFTVRRTRLRLEGHVLDPRLLYKLQFSFTRGDFDYDRTDYPNVLRDAAVGWRLTDATTFWYGQTKLPGNRQRLISSGSQQFVDRSLVNAIFNVDRDLGAQVHHRIGESQPFWLKLAISNGEGRATDNKDDGLAYTSRIEWLPLGEFTNEGDYFEADLAREPEPKFSIGSAYSVNKKTTRPGGQLGRQFTTEGLHRDMETYFVDALYKYQGFSWSAEYARRWTSDPVFMDGPEEVAIYKGYGISTQAGYVFENNIEPAVRLTQIRADKETLAGENDQNQYTMVLSKYFNQHLVKVQTDLTFSEEKNRLENLYSSHWIYRLQLEIGI